MHVPAQGGAVRPGVLEGAEAGDGLGRHRPHGSGSDEVDADVVAARDPGPGSGTAIRGPPWRRPSSRRRATRRWRRSRARRRTATVSGRLQKGQERVDERLQGVGRDVEGDGDVVPAGGEHAAAEAVGRGETDGVQEPVEAIPPRRQRSPGGGELLGEVTSISSTSGSAAACGPCAGSARAPGRPRRARSRPPLPGPAGPPRRPGRRR